MARQLVNCLKVRENQVLLWDAPIQEPALAHALRFWHTWRERPGRPEQRRLYRKSLSWSQSGLFFPGPHGAPLGRAALHNALRRLSAPAVGMFQQRYVKRHKIWHKPHLNNEMWLFCTYQNQTAFRRPILGA
jgi:hypothetical protein